MRLSHTDLLALLTVVAGGVIGASLSLSFLGRSRADDVAVFDLPMIVELPSVPSLRVGVLRFEYPRSGTSASVGARAAHLVRLGQ